MPSDHNLKPEHSTLDEFALAETKRPVLPVVPTVIHAYRAIGQHLATIITVAALVGISSVPVAMEALSFNLTTATGRDFILFNSILLATIAVQSFVYAVFGTRVCRSLILGERRRPLTAIGMIEFRLTLYIAVLMIALAVLANTVPLFYRVQPVLQWELSLSARHLAQITVFLLTVLTIACLFPGVAAISIGARSGLGRSIALALRNMPSLYAIYFLGLFPWMLLDTIGSEFLVFSISADIMGPERPLIIKSIIVGFFYTVAIVLSASAYRTMLHKSEARAAAAFD